MEINYFLDNQQIEFEKLITDVGVEIENVDDIDDILSRRSSSLGDIDDSLMDDDGMDQGKVEPAEDESTAKDDDKETEGNVENGTGTENYC